MRNDQKLSHNQTYNESKLFLAETPSHDTLEIVEILVSNTKYVNFTLWLL